MRQVDPWRPSRRDVLKLGMAAGVAGLTGLAGCGAVPAKPDQNAPQLRGGSYSHGSTGGGLKDTLEPYFPVTNPDIARCLQLYEPLLRWNAQYEIEPSVAESVTPNRDNTQWTVRLRDGVEFHHGKTLTPEDVMFSLAKVTDPKKPGSGGTELAKFLDLKNSKIVDPKTILLQLSAPYAVLDQLLAEYTVGILPTDFDVSHPVGTGPFTYQRFVPGQLSQFNRFDNYWDGPPFVDELIIYDFADDAAKVNALLAGQVQSIDNLPSYLVNTIDQQGASPLISETGAWVPFTMRVDVAPFSDVRVRQALRLIVDRQQMIDQALNGFGILGNDLYSPFDPAFAKRPAAAGAGHRPGQVAAEAGGPGGPGRRAGHLQRGGRGRGGVGQPVRPAGEARRGHRPAEQGRRQRLLRRPLPVLELRPGLLEHPQLHPAGGRVLGQGRDLQRDPLRGPDSSRR